MSRRLDPQGVSPGIRRHRWRTAVRACGEALLVPQYSFSWPLVIPSVVVLWAGAEWIAHHLSPIHAYFFLLVGLLMIPGLAGIWRYARANLRWRLARDRLPICIACGFSPRSSPEHAAPHPTTHNNTNETPCSRCGLTIRTNPRTAPKMLAAAAIHPEVYEFNHPSSAAAALVAIHRQPWYRLRILTLIGWVVLVMFAWVFLLNLIEPIQNAARQDMPWLWHVGGRLAMLSILMTAAAWYFHVQRRISRALLAAARSDPHRHPADAQ